MKISEGFPKTMQEGGITTKIYRSFIKGKYDLFTLAYYMDGKFLKENFGQFDDAIARGKKVIGAQQGRECGPSPCSMKGGFRRYSRSSFGGMF